VVAMAAAARLDQSIALCRRAGFKSILLRGDTDFTQTGDLDRWNDLENVQFVFGIDAMKNLVEKANELAPSAWQPLVRPPKYEIRTQERARPENVKERIVRTGRRVVYRLLAWNPWLGVLLRSAEALRRPMRC